MTFIPSPLENLRFAALLSAALAAVVYANSLTNDFAYDDVHIITENEGIHHLSDVPHALGSPYWPGRFGRDLGLWRPVTTAYLGLQYAVSGENPVTYHVANVLAHAGVTALVVILLGEMLTVAAAFIGGLVFAVHPVHVEAVANVIGIAEVMSAGFFLLACLVHLRSGPTTSWLRALAIGALYALAFGAKEGAVTLPAALFLLDAARGRLGVGDLPDYLRRRGRAYLVMSVVAALMLLARYQVLGSIAHPFGPLGADLLAEIPRIWTLSEIWSHYVRLMVFPMDLSADYSPNVIPIALGWNALALSGAVLALGLFTAALLTWRSGPSWRMGKGSDVPRTLGFGVVWFLITISPVANVVFLAGVLLAERTLYLPSVGFAAIAGWLVVTLEKERPRLGYAVTMMAVLLMGYRTYTRSPTWRDNLTVFGTMIQDYPQSGRSQWVLGDLFFQKGRTKEGLMAYRAAVGLLGPHYQLLTEISKKLIGADMLDGAEHLLRYAWKDQPRFSVAPGLLAVIHSERGDPVGTERYCRIALALDDDDVVSHHLLAWALAEQGKWTEAVEERRTAIRQGQGDYWQQWVSLAYLQAHGGDSASARISLDSAEAKVVTAGARRYVDSLAVALVGERVRPEGKGAAPGDTAAGGSAGR